MRLASLTLVVLASLAGPLAAQSWKFVVSADHRGDVNGVNTEILGEIAAQTVADGAEFIVVPGDLVTTAGATAFSQWKTTMAPVYQAGIGVYPIRGNHDTGSLTAWTNAFGAAIPDNGPAGEVNLTYSFTRHNAFFVGMDQYVSSHRVNQPWLDAQFAANNLPHVFVFGHEPAFKANHADNLDDYPTQRNAFWASIAAEGGRSYFTGHDHFYDHTRIDDGDGNAADDLHQFIVGNGGAPFHTTYAHNGSNLPYSVAPVAHDHATYGYLLVEVDGYDVTMTYKHRVSPGVWEPAGDVFSYTAAPEPASLALLVAGGLAILWRRRRGRG